MYYFRHGSRTYCVDATYDRGEDGFGRLLNHSKHGNLFTKKAR